MNKLIKCVSILLIIVLILGILLSMNRVQAKEQNTKDYTKGSKILDEYPGYS